MKIKKSLSVVTSLSILCLVVAIGISQTKLKGPPMHGDERLITPLVNAGIPLNEAALITALKNENWHIAGSAALVLARFPKTRRMVQALIVTAAHENEIVALSAIHSLVKLHEFGWLPAAIKRLPSMKDPVEQIQLAGLLAQGGYTGGWPIIVSGISKENLTLIALENVSYFDKKKGPDGKSIEVVEELNRLLKIAPPDSRRQIEEKLIRLRASK